MAKEDISFTFDKKPFENGIKSISEKMGNLKKSGENVSKAITKTVSTMVRRLMMIAGAVGSVVVALKQLPEVTQTLGVMKDVFMKNLLWPLRKEIMPMLQKMMDWVRDNRARFVKWGETLVSIFRVVKTMVTNFWNVLKEALGGVKRFIQDMFGLREAENILNILTFKVATIFMFLGALLEPIVMRIGELIAVILPPLVELLGGVFGSIMEGLMAVSGPLTDTFENIKKILEEFLSVNEEGYNLQYIIEGVVDGFMRMLAFVIELTAAFTGGFAEAIEGIMTPLGVLLDSIQSVAEAIFGAEESLKVWKDIFGFLGQVVGTTLRVAFTIIAFSIKQTAEALLFLFDFLGHKIAEWKENGYFDWLIDIVGRLAEKVNELMSNEFFQTVGGALTGAWDFIQDDVYGEGYSERRRNERRGVQDVVITPGGQIIETSPEDFLFATKNPESMAGGVNITIDMSGANFTVTEGNAEQAGMNFAQGLGKQLRNELLDEMERVAL